MEESVSRGRPMNAIKEIVFGACLCFCACRLVDGGRYLSVIGSVWKKRVCLNKWEHAIFVFIFLHLDSNRSIFGIFTGRWCNCKNHLSLLIGIQNMCAFWQNKIANISLTNISLNYSRCFIFAFMAQVIG